MSWLVEQLKKPRWTPYAAGALLGIVAVLALVLNDQLIGSSGSFENLAGILGGLVVPAMTETFYWQYIMPAAITWQVVLMAGVFIGAMVSSLLSGTFKWRLIPDESWKQTRGPKPVKRWIIAFIGGIILEYGAGIAGGCTSGLAIAGTLQLAPAGLVFIIGLFTSGIITSIIIHGRRWRA
ncbi:MAG: YeeE/YedE family protein [Thermoanaerobacteraceae bacterium]|nr:YeeE/YedE family protein [Thermoanaerobacteraceae bacterium]